MQGGCQIEETKKYGQRKEQNKTPKKELSEMEIANLSDAEFKTLAIKKIREVVYSKCIREEIKATLNEIKKNPQGTNSARNEAKVQIKDLEHKEEINSQPEQNEETRIQKNRRE